MKRFDLTPIIIFAVSVMFVLVASFPSIAVTFSGKVVDNKGTPVPGIIVTLQSFEDTSLGQGRIPGHILDLMFSHTFDLRFPPLSSKTDETGVFSISNITSPSLSKLKLLSGENEVISIEIEGILFSIDRGMFNRPNSGFVFVIAQDTGIKDVTVTVRPRMRIHAQVVSSDGTPLRNVRVDNEIKWRGINGGNSSESGTMRLDAEGCFVRYVDHAGYYTLSVKYQGQSAVSQEILLAKGQRLDGLRLTLEGEQKPPKVLIPPKPKESVPRRFDSERERAATQRRRAGVWIVNPETRHAYKRIYCQTHKEAQERATAEDAHLVAINDKSEQDWLLAVFGKESFWIGLTNGLKEGKRHWDNGEPVSWTNWNSLLQIAVGNDSEAGKNHTVLIGFTGKWQAAQQGSHVARTTKKAILEKEIPIIGNPKSDSENETH